MDACRVYANFISDGYNNIIKREILTLPEFAMQNSPFFLL